ncbi:MAG TPA: hypothetical protein VHD56_13005 [Tepidisphaeraceae bacterium]|nr:hypothetical protein [Tepidisphaeraceae bacterium]
MWLLSALIVSKTMMPAHKAQLDCVMLFGFLSAFATLACLGHVRKYRGARLLFSLCLACQAIYGFERGAWPLGVVAVVCSTFTAHWWWKDAPRHRDSLNLLRNAGDRNDSSNIPQMQVNRVLRFIPDDHHPAENN